MATLVSTLGLLDRGASELELCMKWLELIRANSDLMPNGWYQPPPGGAAILIANSSNFSRLNYDSLRRPIYWPSHEKYASVDSIVYSYCSPIHRSTGMMGDIAVTIYRGQQKKIMDGLSQSIDIISRIVRRATVGMSYGELFEYASDLMQTAGLSNLVHRTADPDSVNIGHTVPWVYGPYPEDADEWLRGRAKRDIGHLLSNARNFIQAGNTDRIAPTAVFTIEPRLMADDLPQLSFHVIVVFLDGTKIVCSEFKSLFEMFGMCNYLPHDALQTIGSA